jgi:hypothetical protein
MMRSCFRLFRPLPLRFLKRFFYARPIRSALARPTPDPAFSRFFHPMPAPTNMNDNTTLAQQMVAAAPATTRNVMN